MALNQQDLELFAEKLATAMVTAQVEMMQKTDALLKIKRGAANMALSATGALVAFVILSWAGEYRDQSKLAASNADKAFAAGDEARTLAKLSKAESTLALDGYSKNDARITSLTNEVAALAARQQQTAGETSPLELPASAVDEKRAELLEAQDKALYRQQQSVPRK